MYQLAILSLLILVPFSVSAQGITGSVSDDTGGVLPGVTVEASSPALIEGVRTAFTDGSGLYSITNLAPGTYSVTFTLPGFSTIIREGVVLTAGFTANIDAAMQVGGIEETITVTGASPLVDVRTTVAQSSVSTELLKALPTGGGFTAQSLITLVPGVTGTADVGGSSGIYRSNGQSGGMFFHGKSDVIVLYDGMGTASPNGISIPHVLNSEFASETVMETGGGNAESNATMVMNLIPKEGANNFSFRTAGTYTNDSMQGRQLGSGADGPRRRIHERPLEVLQLRHHRRRPDRPGQGVVLCGGSRGPQQESGAQYVFQQWRGHAVLRARSVSQGVPNGVDAERRWPGDVAGEPEE